MDSVSLSHVIARPVGAGAPPLVCHVVYRFAVGGLENGVVNLINHMSPERFRHAVVSLTDIDAVFARRVQRDDVAMIALHKPPGQGFLQWPKLWHTFRSLRPALVHTRNLAALEAQVPAWAAGVQARVHGEHGREGRDLTHGPSPYDSVRRFYRRWVGHYVALSRELEAYLLGPIGVARDKLTCIHNGVDTQVFAPSPVGVSTIRGCPFDAECQLLVGAVGRMQEVKAPMNLARAFVRACELAPDLGRRMRLVMVGDGPLRGEVMEYLRCAGVSDACWLPGERADVADVLRGLHLFVLPSRSEGVSNVLLEAMATGLPLIATAVGGNPELVADGRTGVLVPPEQPEALATALVELGAHPRRAAELGRAARVEAEERFSIRSMVTAYASVYDRALGRRSAWA